MLVMRVSGATKKPLPREVGVWMVTTAGITRAIRSSSAAGVTAPDGAASRWGATGRSGTGSAGGVVCGDAGAGACRTTIVVVESGAVADDDTAGCRLLIHHTVAAIVTADTLSSAPVWTRMDPADVPLSGISVLSVKTPVLFTTKDTKDTKEILGSGPEI